MSTPPADEATSTSPTADATTTDAPTKGLGPRYHKLWTASAVSNFGDGLDSAALPLLAVLLTRDPLLIAGVAFANKLPWLLFALQAGAIADRVDRKRLMSAVNAVRFVLMAGLGLAVLGDWATIWLLYVVAFALGVGETLFDNAAQAFMPALVRRDQLETANGRLYGVEIMGNQFVGPPVGGFLFGIAAALPILIDAGTYAISALLILAIPGTYAARRAQPAGEEIKRRMRDEIGEGLRWLWGHRLLRTLALKLGLLNGMGSAAMAIFVLFAVEILEVSEFGFGVLLTAFAVGALLGTVSAGPITKIVGRGPALIGSVAIFGLTSIVQGLTSSPYVFGAASAFAGIGVVVWNVVTVSLRQTIIPDELLGRVNSVYRFIGWGSIPIGALIGGVIATLFGLRAPFLVSGVVILVGLVVILPIVNTRTIEEARAAAPTPTEE
jgi:MFS family permease